jgi:phage tail sheath gpL-like
LTPTGAGHSLYFGLLGNNIDVSNNYLTGGDGPDSIGISIRSYAGEIPEPDTGVVLNSNVIGNFVTAVQHP